MKISLIIPFYKKINFLEAIFKQLSRQSFKDFEVIIAEDNNQQEAKQFINEAKLNYSFPIKHIQQVDNGFRKNMAMNKAISIAEGSLLVFIDGDCLPKPNFLQVYHKYAEKGTILWGRRVMLSPKLTKSILEQPQAPLPSIVKVLTSDSKKKEEGIYSHFLNKIRKSTRNFKGCNWGVLKEDILKINGFDEDYVLATVGEDDDLEWRFAQLGFTKKSLRNLAIVYHLWHEPNYDQQASIINNKIMKQKQIAGNAYTENGLDKYL